MQQSPFVLSKPTDPRATTLHSNMKLRQLEQDFCRCQECMSASKTRSTQDKIQRRWEAQRTRAPAERDTTTACPTCCDCTEARFNARLASPVTVPVEPQIPADAPPGMKHNWVGKRPGATLAPSCMKTAPPSRVAQSRSPCLKSSQSGTAAGEPYPETHVSVLHLEQELCNTI